MVPRAGSGPDSASINLGQAPDLLGLQVPPVKRLSPPAYGAARTVHDLIHGKPSTLPTVNAPCPLTVIYSSPVLHKHCAFYSFSLSPHHDSLSILSISQIKKKSSEPADCQSHKALGRGSRLRVSNTQGLLPLPLEGLACTFSTHNCTPVTCSTGIKRGTR